MASRRAKAKSFIEQYNLELNEHKKAAEALESLLKEILADPSLEIHLICSRCKDPRSLRMKLFEKNYANPARQLTDMVAARVITYYSHDVDRVAAKLSSALTVDPRNSGDKRKLLTLKEFGYKSVHLQLQTKASWASDPKYAALRGRWCEVQIRSILEHAWAEIEHEVVYKSEIRYPDEIKRKFARLAGAVEILEEEFLQLRNAREALINEQKARFQSGLVGRDSLDSVKMIALLEVEQPAAKGWRRAAEESKPFESKSDALCVKALRRANVRSPYKLRRILRSAKLRRAMRRISERGEEITHYSQVLLSIAVTSRRVFSDYFPTSRIQQLLGSQPPGGWRRRIARR